jgi:Saxitoxin biosynthesis operon protein SxtJ
MIKIDLKPDVDQLRSFGFIGLIGFPLIATVGLWKFTDWQMHWPIWMLLGLGGLGAALSLIAPIANKPVYLTMMIIALPIGFVVSAVVLRLIYYGMFTPIALWFRLKGRDAMERKLEPDAETYWKDHRDQVKPRAPSSYLRLY